MGHKDDDDDIENDKDYEDHHLLCIHDPNWIGITETKGQQ